MNNQSEMIIYQTQDGLTRIDVAFDHDTVWLVRVTKGRFQPWSHDWLW